MRPATRALSAAVVLILGVAPARAMDPTGTVGPGKGALGEGRSEAPCGSIFSRTDGPYENGYAWLYGGNVPPQYGAFAECYSGSYEICGVALDLTTVGFGAEGTFEIYLWGDGGGQPGAVLAMLHIPDHGGMGFWPNVTRNVYAFSAPTCVDGVWWVGFRGTWEWADIFIAADLDGPLGCPRTNIAPGFGFPTGWQDVSVAWAPTHSLGIGAQINVCLPVPDRPSTWGRVKRLYF
ncbi:MAG: hypothetical protein U0527_04650 [Candidatus Eisenbacteria bacterium]